MKIKFDEMRWYEISSFSTSIDSNECNIRLRKFGGSGLDDYIKEFVNEATSHGIQVLPQGDGSLCVFYKDYIEIKSLN